MHRARKPAQTADLRTTMAAAVAAAVVVSAGKISVESLSTAVTKRQVVFPGETNEFACSIPVSNLGCLVPFLLSVLTDALGYPCTLTKPS